MDSVFADIMTENGYRCYGLGNLDRYGMRSEVNKCRSLADQGKLSKKRFRIGRRWFEEFKVASDYANKR